MMAEPIELFIEKFFSNVGAKISKEGTIIKVENVPANVESFLGKKSPYLLELLPSPNTPREAELITQGSFFLKAMNDYLNTKGQTTLLKIDFSDFLEKPLQFPGKLKNCEVYKQEIKPTFKTITRFTFQTIFQYKNEKESLVNDIYVKEGKLFCLDLSKLKTLEGKPDEVKLDDVKEDFNTAKAYLKERFAPKLDSIKKELEITLEKELQRIENHYNSQTQELTLTLNRFENQIKEAEKKGDLSKVSRLTEDIKNLKERINNPQRTAEKNFLIQDEKNKLSINLGNKLLNTTIFYYPEYEFKIYLKKESAIKPISIIVDPLNISINPFSCENCQKIIQDIYLCNSGHLSCANCLSECSDCHSPTCKLCSKKECKICNRRICKKCDRKCASCYSVICATHSREEKSTMRHLCSNCAKQCYSCLQWFRSSKLKTLEGRQVCDTCKTLAALRKPDY